MTGDGLRFALRGAELAAEEALRTLQRWNPRTCVFTTGAAASSRRKWRFNPRFAVSLHQRVTVRTAGDTLTSWPLRRIIDAPGTCRASEQGS